MKYFILITKSRLEMRIYNALNYRMATYEVDSIAHASTVFNEFKKRSETKSKQGVKK